MANTRFILNETSYFGFGAREVLLDELKDRGYKRVFLVSDKSLVDAGVTDKVMNILEEGKVRYELYDDVKPNPSIDNVLHGYKKSRWFRPDVILAVGGGSSMDTAKAISILMTNPDRDDVVSLNGPSNTKKKGLPMIAMPTTAGTAAEVTINYVITDEEREVKMVCVDPHDIPVLAIVDTELMASMPKKLAAATGMDALTHAMEAVVANGAIDVTDATALYAIKQIFEYLPRAVENGQDIEAREQMCYACFLNGIAFSNAGLGNVHAMAHQLGGLYDLPHGVCNAMLLPIVEEENAKQAPAKFRVMAETIGMDVEGKTDEECMDFVIGKIKELSERVGIPKTLSELGVENPDFETLAENSMKDACAGANPVFFDKELLIKLFKKIA